MLALAKIGSQQERPVSLKQISAQEGISVSYLEQLFVHLRRAGLVKSVRGPGGGYLFARPPHEITVGEIMQVVQECVQPVNCAECTQEFPYPGCDIPRGSSECMSRPLWEKLEKKIDDFLNSVTLQDIIDQKV